jgi:hypothetical protein
VQSQLVAVTYDTQNPARLAQFWAALLGRERIEDAEAVVLPGGDGQLGLRFVADDAPPHTQHRMHMHLTSTSLPDQQRTVAAAVELGAGHLDIGQRPEEGHIVLSDPGGYAFCVIAPGNAYLAGCGLFGELSCDGTRAVGFFWSEVLHWPVVWDRDEETAVQSPQGGTKVAWGGEPVSSRQGSDRQRFELVATGGGLQAEVDRLVGLGARHLQTVADGVILLADPDGTEFRLRAR